MGAIVDTTVFIDLERSSPHHEFALSGDLIGKRLTECLGAEEEAAIAAITASELLHGVHRANAEHRARRGAFVESILAVVPVLDFDLLAARAHARLSAELVRAGSDVGAHDRIVAATAISLGWRVATANVRHFNRVPGLDVIAVR
ncbi:MAG: PIN domain-containing protein [Streptosporangiaceae bacterium]